MNAPEAALLAAPYAASIALSLITPSATNPRKRFDKDALADLTDSVRKHGIIQPILVRQIDPAIAAYELVAGERRYRAATAAGLEEIPAIVRNLTDVEALELQVIENLQRADLHPIEEAEGYEQLRDRHGYSIDELAAKVGKSKAYVYARLKFTDLCKEAREAFFAGELNASTALLIARIPTDKVQKAALKELTATDHRGEVMPVRMAAEHIQRSYMLKLKEAPFSPNDEKLVPKAGSCGACPKRTGNQPELFGDVKSADTCTDPTCFAGKKEAHFARLRADAEAKGATVITGKDAKAIIPNEWSAMQQGWIGADQKVWEDAKDRTAKAIMGKGHVWTLIEHPVSHELVPIIKLADVHAHLGNKATKPAKTTSGPASTTKRSQNEIDEDTHEDTISGAVIAAIRAAPPQAFSHADFVEVALALTECTSLDAAAFGCTESTSRYEPFLRNWMLTLSTHELATMMLCFAVFNYDDTGDLAGVLQRRGIDRATIVKDVIAAEKAKEPPKPTTTTKGKSK